MVSYWRLLWKPRWLRNAIHPPCSDPSSFPRLVYHPHMGRISIARKEGEVLLSRQLRFSQCKWDPISSSNLTSDSICQQSAPPPDTRRLRSSWGCQLCSQMLPFARPVFLKAVFKKYISKCWMTLVISGAVWPWVAERSGAAGPPWRPGGLEATDSSVAWRSWQTGLPSGPRHPGRPSLPSKFKCAPSHKCIMGTRIPRLRTYQALSLRLWAPEHTGNCGHPVGTSCFQFVGRTRVGLFYWVFFFTFTQNPYCVLLRQQLIDLS